MEGKNVSICFGEKHFINIINSWRKWENAHFKKKKKKKNYHFAQFPKLIREIPFF